MSRSTPRRRRRTAAARCRAQAWSATTQSRAVPRPTRHPTRPRDRSPVRRVAGDIARAIRGAERLEVDDDRVDIGLRPRDAHAAQRYQLTGALDVVGEQVDVEVVAVEL